MYNPSISSYLYKMKQFSTTTTVKKNNNDGNN